MLSKKKVYRVTAGPRSSKSTESILSRADAPPKKCRALNSFLGLFYTAMTSVFITLTSVFVKKLTYITPGELSMVRNIGVWTGCLPIALYSVREVLGERKERPMLIARGFMGATALYLNLTAFRYLPLSLAATIMSSMPAVITIMARLYLKEPCGVFQGLALVITALGVLLSVRLPEMLMGQTVRPSTDQDGNYLFGLLSAVGCVLILSVSFVALRKMKGVHFSVTLLYTGLIGMLENGAITLTTSRFTAPRCEGWDRALVVLIGAFGFVGHCTMTLAIQVEAVSIVSVMNASLNIVVALVFQALFFGVAPDVYNLGGACLVIFSVSIIGLKKWVATLPEDAAAKRRLRFLLR